MKKLLLSCNYSNSIVADQMAKTLSEHFSKEIVILNIGTNKHIHDTLGPLVGTMLNNNGFRFPVYGTLDNPVDNSNIIETIKKLYLKYGENLFILAIDACYAEGMDGTISLRNSAIKPGTSVRDSFIGVGDMSIIGVVNSFYKKHPMVEDFDIVADLAKVISNILMKAQDNYLGLVEKYSA
ncbi:MAG: spore protease YyaC [Bacillota bacterium]|nr:spore protease YyaC [Bacillota bacterium]